MNSQKTRFYLRNGACLLAVAIAQFCLNFEGFEKHRSLAEEYLGLPFGYLWIPITLLILFLISFQLNRIYSKILAPIRAIADHCATGGLQEGNDYNQSRESRIIANFVQRTQEIAEANKEETRLASEELRENRKERNRAQRELERLARLLESHERVRERLMKEGAKLRRENRALAEKLGEPAASLHFVTPPK